MRQPKPQGPWQIIIIDDEPELAKLLKMILTENISCEVETFNNSFEAFQRLQEKQFDLISLDFRMPGMTGIELITTVRIREGLNQRTPVLLFTGFRHEAEPLANELIDNLIFLEKPVSNSRYVAVAKMALLMVPFEKENGFEAESET